MTITVPGTTTRGHKFTVRSRTIRGITYMPHGQRVETWLPAGEWQCDGECNLQASRDSTDMVPAVIVYRADKFDGVWYIAPDLITARMDAIDRALAEVTGGAHGPTDRSQVYHRASDLWFNRSYASTTYTGKGAFREFGEAVAREWERRQS